MKLHRPTSPRITHLWQIAALLAAVSLLVISAWTAVAQVPQPTTRDVIKQIEDSAKVLTGHQSAITHLRYSPDGNWIASSSGDGSVRLWDGHSGESAAVWWGHTEPAVIDVAFSPDSRLVASASMDSTVRIWTIGDDTTNTIHFDERLLSVRFSADGNWLAVGGRDGTLFLLDISEGFNHLFLNATLSAHEEGITALAFSPDGLRLATSSFDGTVRLWDLATYETLLTLRPDVDVSYNISQMDVVFSPDGTYLFSSDGMNGGSLVRVWDVSTGEQVATFPSDGPTDAIALSPDGKILASATRSMESGLQGVVQLWDITSGEQIASLHGHGRGTLKGLAFSPDGATLASAGEDHTIRLWNVGLLLGTQPLQPTPEREPIQVPPATVVP